MEIRTKVRNQPLQVLEKRKAGAVWRLRHCKGRSPVPGTPRADALGLTYSMYRAMRAPPKISVPLSSPKYHADTGSAWCKTSTVSFFTRGCALYGRSVSSLSSRFPSALQQWSSVMHLQWTLKGLKGYQSLGERKAQIKLLLRFLLRLLTQ